ncbi:hypothetical protein C7451_11269 [Blastomonas natatoria]|uniref:Sugar transporter n=1 Tax=Blastomonas natatoria TaxID=34015 RepID=A0A2V3V778_9SPHN|nr:hypothetical protein [Blastomonas natatoria]PXW71625.1 hypothetical protein C7451_11269 [Blastomonas natatoria]
MILSRPLGWFWLLAIVLLAWNVIGLVALLFDPVLGVGDVSKLAAEQQAIYAERPAIAFYGFVLATVAGTAGAIALLLRRNIALWLFVASAIGLVLQNAWLFADPSRLSADVLGFQALVAGSIALAIWLALTARKRRWSR